MPLILDGTTGASLIATTAIPASVVLSTPASGTMTNVTAVPAAQLTGTVAVANGGTGVTTSTGTGANVLGTSPTLITPNIGVAVATGLSMFGLITGQASTATDVNTANDAGALSCRSDGAATTVASMTFHRPGAFAINMGLGADNVFRIGGWSASNNCFQLDGSGNATILSNLKFNSGYGSAATAYGCRAWVNFNGTGTVAINASANVSSITDNGTGDYSVNFTTAMPDANYAAHVSMKPISVWGETGNLNTLSSGVLRVATLNSATSAFIDVTIITATVFR